MKSLLGLIMNNKDENGELKAGFSLPREVKDGEPRFADGAMDGITLYHTRITPLSDEERDKLLGILRNPTESGFAAFCKDHRAVTVIDEIQNTIMAHKEEMSPDALFRFSVDLILQSMNIECVKVGLIILELLKVYDNDVVVEAIKNLGLSDEFTIFAVFLMKHWPDGDREILELAKKVHGWGRIHCVFYIDPVDEEIRKWILINGVDNEVLPEYSAYDSYVKADIENLLLRDDLSMEEMSGILKITDAMLNEGPVSGISRLESPKEYLDKVVEKSNAFKLSDEDKERVERIRQSDV